MTPAWQGKVVPLNIWASWRAPCRRETPSLQALAAALPEHRFAVVAVAPDAGDGRPVRAFLARHRWPHMTVMLRQAHRLGSAAAAPPRLPARLLPTSYAIDAQGGVPAYLTGPMDWMAAPARAFIRVFLHAT
jgi:thiol-disulfide isomerase/thioredoxin